ncbi:hypothetical protein [Planktotalea sp.]|uniref:hypothetical protein n=1 Tax=Planktotalea sp. TaxID=2029877 RepID=UPI003F6CC0CF
MFSDFDDTDAKCGFIGPNGRQFSALREMLGANRMTLEEAQSFAVFNSLSYADADAHDFLFVDLDGLGGIGKVFDRLVSLRTNYPTVPVIMISSEFKRNDFERSRQALGDISLRSPILYSSLEMSLFEATKNNQHWQNNLIDYNQNVAA